MNARLEESAQLGDGRRLGYAELGDPSGSPVLFFHGVPGSRLDFATERHDEAFRAAGVRFIGVDRPGFGISDPKPGRGHGEWPADVGTLADSLELERFAVLGYSRGGWYALACAAQVPERLTAVGLLSALTIPDMPGFERARPWLARLDSALARRAPAFWDKLTAANKRRAEKDPAAALRVYKLVLRAPADRDLLAATPREFAGYGIEAARNGPAAWRMEVANIGTALDFDVDEVKVPVRIWHGTADTLVPITHGRYSAKRLASAEIVELPEVGHLHSPERIAQIASQLVGQTSALPSG